MLQAAKVNVLLTQEKLHPLFRGIAEIDLLSLDADWSEISQEEGVTWRSGQHPIISFI